jgi:hypothetical protein
MQTTNNDCCTETSLAIYYKCDPDRVFVAIPASNCVGERAVIQTRVAKFDI